MDVFSFIKKNVSIESVVSEYTTLKRAGNYLKARCPFHSEKTASFTISPGKEIFYCFGCQKGGDVVTFVSLFEKCGQREAALLIAERYNLTVPEFEAKGVPARDVKERYLYLCKVLHEWFCNQYDQSAEIKKYVLSRGISSTTAQKFALGYFSGNKYALTSLIQHAQKASILLKELIDAHILFPSSDGSYYSPFEDRLIIPIADTLGRICGFGGRIFRMGDTRAKYYNSHENEFFSKGTLLFGLSLAKEEIRTKKSVFVVEGYMDCIMMVQQGYKNTVATLGTACTEAHLKQLSRYSDTIYIIYDGDDAGKNALLRIAEKCWRSNVEPLVLSLPVGEDPASFLVKYKSLDSIISSGKNIFSFFIAQHAESIKEKTLGEKMQAIKSVLEVIMHIDDPIKQTLLLSQASSALAVDDAVLKKEIKRMEQKQGEKGEKQEHEGHSKDNIENQNIEEREQQDVTIRMLLGYMLQNPQHIDQFLITLCSFSKNQKLQQISTCLLEILQKQQIASCSFDTLWGLFQESERQIVSELIMQRDSCIDFELFKQQAQQFERQMFKRVVHSFKVQIARSIKENNHETTDSLLKQLVDIQKRFKRET